MALTKPRTSGILHQGVALDKYLDSLQVVYVANGVNDGAGILAASIEAAQKGASLAISGVANVTSPVTLPSRIAYTEKQIFTLGSMVTLSCRYALPDWFGDVEGAVDAAVNAMPDDVGGFIKLLDKRYKTNRHRYGFNSDAGHALTKSNITIIGARQPHPSHNYDRLVGGSIIEGSFHIWADNFHGSDFGVDCGKYVLETYYNNTPEYGHNEGFFCSFKDEATKNTEAHKVGLRTHNITGLCYSPSAPSHSFIIEGYIDSVCTGLTRGIMGVHGAVFKAREVIVDNVMAECNNANGLIIKSDSQASAQAITVSIKRAVVYAKGVPGSAPFETASGSAALRFDMVQEGVDGVSIDSLYSRDCPIGIDFSGTKPLLSCNIDNFYFDASSAPSSWAIRDHTMGERWRQIRIGNLEARNCNQVISTAANNTIVLVSTLEAAQITDALVDVQGTTNVVIDSISTIGAGQPYLWRVNGTPKLHIGTVKQQTPATSEFAPDSLQPTLAAGWVVGQQAFTCKLRNYSVILNGLIRSTSTATTTCVDLPNTFGCAEQQRYPTLTKSQSAGGPVFGTLLATATYVSANEFGGPNPWQASDDFISINISWPMG